MIYLLKMDYYYFVFSLIVLIVKCNVGKLTATETQHDLVTSLSLSDTDPVYYTAEINKPLELHFQNVSISSGWCVDFYDYSTLEATFSHSMIQVQNVTYRMSTLWKCYLMENDVKKNLKPICYILFINLHVKGAKSVELSVNGKDLTFSEVDLSVPYDGNTVYFYEDGENVQVVCRNPQSTGTVHLEYFMNDTRNVSESATFEIQLHSGSNHSYIDCVYVNAGPADRYMYRVTFVIKKPSFYSKGGKILSDLKISSPVFLGSSIGAVFVLLTVTGVAYYCLRTRNARHIETPYGDLTNKNDNEYENQYEACYETPESAESMSQSENYYEKIDYSRCKPKICETQTRKSVIYDEPYVQITLKMQHNYVNVTTSFKA